MVSHTQETTGRSRPALLPARLTPINQCTIASAKQPLGWALTFELEVPPVKYLLAIGVVETENQPISSMILLDREFLHSGMTTISSRGIASSVTLSIIRWAMTSSGGVWVSHSERERSW